MSFEVFVQSIPGTQDGTRDAPLEARPSADQKEFIVLSREEQTAFVSALLEPAAPRARLQQAARAYRERREG